MPYTYLVPQDTRRAAQQEAHKCLNLGLVLDRFIPQEAIRNDNITNDLGRVTGKVRPTWLKNQLSNYTQDTLVALATAEANRWVARTKGALQFQMMLQDRMVVGLGGKGPLEIGITLHPVTGMPYIPGSALKGLCRAFALLQIASDKSVNASIDAEALVALDKEICSENAYAELATADRYRLAFGTQEQAGRCVFHDAVLFGFPERNRSPQPLFTLDVMTPHFVKYYSSGGTAAPHDSDNPNPVNYITVTGRTVFAFAVGTRTGFQDNLNTAKQARIWLKAALQELGVGAKTAQGYGVFVPIPK